MYQDLLKKNEKENFYIQAFDKSLPREIEIYEDISLSLSRPLLKTSRVFNKTNNELGAIFRLEGELTGFIVCLIDIFEKNIASNSYTKFQALFTESMNILLGQFLTNLESEANIMSVLGAPKIVTRNESLNLKTSNKKDFKLSAGHKLLLKDQYYDCRIYILANYPKVSEV